MDNLDTLSGSSGFQQLLLVIGQDPQVIGLARKWTGDPDLADDALLAACYSVATASHPDRIGDLRAYFLRTLRHEAMYLRAPRRPAPVEDPRVLLRVGTNRDEVS
jgi:DNA-directed RNA polymerase specialized sigma24 family protein